MQSETMQALGSTQALWKKPRKIGERGKCPQIPLFPQTLSQGATLLLSETSIACPTGYRRIVEKLWRWDSLFTDPTLKFLRSGRVISLL